VWLGHGTEAGQMRGLRLNPLDDKPMPKP